MNRVLETQIGDANNTYRRIAEWLLLGMAAAAPCLGALDGPFYYFDDKQMIFESPFIRGERSVFSAFWLPYFHHYAPFHEMLLYVQWYLFGATLPFPHWNHAFKIRCGTGLCVPPFLRASQEFEHNR